MAESVRHQAKENLTCGQAHPLPHCYYIILEIAPDWFKSRDHLQSKVERKLRDDTEPESLFGKELGNKRRTSRSQQLQGPMRR